VFDVETTCPCSFHLGDPKEQVAVASKAIGSAASADVSKAHVCGKRDSPIFVDHRCALVPAKIGTVPREVTPIQLAAMIYYNRGVDLLAEKRFAEAAAANAKALRLDPNNATARGNLLATINNWSIELGNTQHFAEAVELLRQGLAMDAKFEAFTQNYIHVHRQWAEQLSREGRFEEAKRVKAQAGAMVPLPCVQRRPVVD
jgi:tetratricopeptide (TPR) repeat protein